MAVPRFVRRVNTAHSMPRKAPPIAVIASSENTVERLGHPPATLVLLVPRENTATGRARYRWTSAAQRVRQAHIREAAHQVVPRVTLARPRNLANPSASRAFPGPSWSPDSARCALLELTRASRPRRVRAARPESTSPKMSRRRASHACLERTATKQASRSSHRVNYANRVGTARLLVPPTRISATSVVLGNMATKGGSLVRVGGERVGAAAIWDEAEFEDE